MPQFNIGDRVQLVMLAKNWLHWVDPINELLGQFATVREINLEHFNGAFASIVFDDGNDWAVPLCCIVKEDDAIQEGDKVRIVGEWDGKGMGGRVDKKQEMFNDGKLYTISQVERWNVDHDKRYGHHSLRYVVRDERGIPASFYRAFLEKVEVKKEEKKVELKVGSIVVCPKIPQDRKAWPQFVEGMEAFVGKPLEIVKVRNDGNKDQPVLYVCKVAGKAGVSYVFRPEWLAGYDGKKIKVKKPRVKKDRPITSAYIQEMLKEARAKLSVSYSQAGVCNYAVVEQEGTKLKVRYQIGDVCHARMGTGYRGGQAVTMLDWIGDFDKSAHRSKHLPIFKKYVKYVMTESPAKGSWITKRPQDALKYGLVIDNTKTVTQLAFATFMMRMGREYPDRLPVFDLITKAGYSGDVAFLLFSCFRAGMGDKFTVSGVCGHSAISSTHEYKELIKFFSGKRKFVEGKPYTEKASGWNVFDQVGKMAGYEKSDNSLMSTLLRIMGLKQEGGFGATASATKEQLLKAAEYVANSFKEVK